MHTYDEDEEKDAGNDTDRRAYHIAREERAIAGPEEVTDHGVGHNGCNLQQ